MKEIALAIVVMMLAFAGSALAGGIADVPWNQRHIQTLQSSDKAGLVKLLNECWLGSFKTSDIGQFRWADLAGNGQYELLLTLSGPCGLPTRSRDGVVRESARLAHVVGHSMTRHRIATHRFS